MSHYRNVVIDLETLGRSPGCVVLSLGAVAFDAKGFGPEFYSVIALASCLQLGLHIDKATQAWWDKQSPAARKVLSDANEIGAPQVHDLIKNFNTWLLQFTHGGVKVWGNGANFDNPILTAVYHAAGFEPPWPFWYEWKKL